jgi:drug/metabolite transporter (DMT)-like permease
MKSQTKAFIYACAAVLMWSTVATAFKIALARMGFVQLLFYSSAVSTVVLFLILVFQRKLASLRKFGWREIGSSAFMGFLNPFLYYLVLFKSYSLLPAQIAQPLNYSWGVVLVIFSALFLGQKIGARGFVSIFFGFFGVVLIATGGKFGGMAFDAFGVALGLGSAFIWASYWILNLRNKADISLKLFVNFLFGTIFVAGAMHISGETFLISLSAGMAAMFVGFFEMGITFVFWLKALKLSESSARVANLIYLSPFLSLVFIRNFLGEDIRPATILGLTLIVAGIIAGNSPINKNIKPNIIL